MPLRSTLAISLFYALLGFAPRVSAEPAAAEALFREGRRLLDQGQYQDAAIKLAESQAQDPASGTLINLALAYEKQGKLATAWVTYQDAAAFARRDGRADRVASAERKARELEPRIPRVVFRSQTPADGLIIQLGTVKIGPGALGSSIPIDPGEYHVIANAPGRQSWEAALTIAEGERPELIVPNLAALPPPEDAKRAEPKTPSEEIGGARSRPTAPPTVPPPSSVLPWVLGASGAVILGVGSVFGVRAFSRYSDAEQACPSHQACSPGAMEALQEARTSAWVADIAIAAGVAACATSAWLFLTRSDAKPNAVLGVTPLKGGAALSLRAQL